MAHVQNLTLKITTNAFDGTTVVPDDATWEFDGNSTYELKSSAGADLAAVGLLPVSVLLKLPGMSNATEAFLPSVTHNAGAGVTSFDAVVGVLNGAAFEGLYPARSSNPATDGGRAGALAYFTSDEVMFLRTNAAGAQTVFITFAPGQPDGEALVGVLTPQTQSPVLFGSAYIRDNLNANTYTTHVPWPMQTGVIEEAQLTTNAAVAGGDLVVEGEIIGVGALFAALVIPAGSPAGFTVALEPAGNNTIVTNGNIRWRVTGGGNTTPGDSTVSWRVRPFT